MRHKIELIELYLPDVMVSNQDIQLNSVKLKAFEFFLKSGSLTLSSDLVPVQEILGHEAALCAYFLDLDPACFFIKADPVQYILDMNQGVMIPGAFYLESAEALIEKLNIFLAEDKLTLIRLDDKNMLIASQKPIDYIAPSLLNAINQAISLDRFSGQDKAYWQRLSTELQFLFSQNKLNQNDPDGVYFWGAGVLPKDSLNINASFNQVIANDYAVLGLAKLAKIEFNQVGFKSLENILENIVKKTADLNKQNKILITTQDFSLFLGEGNTLEYEKLSIFFNELLVELIRLVKNKQLAKLVLNTGQKRYQLTRASILKSYLLSGFKFVI